MEIIWQWVPIISSWLLYGILASFFVKNVKVSDGLLLVVSGLFGGYIGGHLSNILNPPANLWWLEEAIKLGVTILSMHTLHNVFKWRKYKK